MSAVNVLAISYITAIEKCSCLPKKKDIETVLWNTLCLDLIGPYKIDLPNNETLKLHCVTMIDPATGWFKIAEIPKKSADIVSNVVETTWLSGYPWPTKIVLDCSKEFMAEFIQMIKNDYNDITLLRITMQNP